MLFEAIVEVDGKWREAFRVDPSVGHFASGSEMWRILRHNDVLISAWHTMTVKLGVGSDWLI